MRRALVYHCNLVQGEDHNATKKSMVRIFCLPVLALFALTACDRPVTTIDLIMPALPINQVIAQQIVELVDEESGLRINLIPPPEGSLSVLDALESGYGDIAFVPNNKGYRENITTIMPLYPRVLHIVAGKDRPAGNLEELLSGATVYAGPEGSMSRVIGEEIVDDLDFLPGEVTFSDGLGMKPDVIILYVPIDRDRVMNDPRLKNVKFFSFGKPEDIGRGSAADRVVLLNPRLRPFVIPIGTYGALTPEPVVTLAVDNLLVSREDLDETLVYDLFAEMLRLRPALFSARPELFQPLDEQVARSNFTFSLHPGALHFLQRDEPSFIERYSSVAEVLVTLLVGLISGAFAFVKIYSIRRKNRIDEYFTAVIEIRNSVAPDSSSDERAVAIASIRAMQDRGFEMLVDEQLAADESFRIFIGLANDSISHINELGTIRIPN